MHGNLTLPAVPQRRPQGASLDAHMSHHHIGNKYASLDAYSQCAIQILWILKGVMCVWGLHV